MGDAEGDAPATTKAVFKGGGGGGRRQIRKRKVDSDEEEAKPAAPPVVKMIIGAAPALAAAGSAPDQSLPASFLYPQHDSTAAWPSLDSSPAAFSNFLPYRACSAWILSSTNCCF